MSELENLREALSKISEIAGASVRKNGANGYDHADMADQAVCTPKSLPKHLQLKAAKTATDVNPMNAPVLGFVPADDAVAAAVSSPLSIAVLTSKYWGSAARRLTVSFMDATPADLRARILAHMNAWSMRDTVRANQRHWSGAHLSGGRWVLVLSRNGCPAYSEQSSDDESPGLYDDHAGIRV